MENATATSQETLLWLLKKSKRQGTVPVHNCFLQTGKGRSVTPGPLAAFVSAGRQTALDLYLLGLLLASGKPYNVAQPSGVWSRILGVGTPETAASTISKQWKWLEEQKLIARAGRRGQYAEIVMLREDGSGDPYVPGLRGGNWFHVPFEYWTDHWFGKLSLPAKAVLLIGLSLLDDFVLPETKAPAWYGISPDTAGRGLRALREHGLLKVRRLQKPSEGAPRGFTVQHHYTLAPPFGPRGKRSKLLTRAREIRDEGTNL